MRYTAFCMEANRTGTMWIGGIEAENEEAAMEAAVEECAEDWGWQERTDDIECVGLAEGEVKIVTWAD